MAPDVVAFAVCTIDLTARRRCLLPDLLLLLTHSWCVALQDGTQKSQKVFVNIPTEVGATEAEEIGAPA